MSDFYQLTNSTTDFKSRTNDVFDKLVNIEKQHDVHTKTQTPILDEETPSSSQQNPTIPSHAITFKKRPADDTFTRPIDKWKKYDLEDVNEHHLTGAGNRHALTDFLRTRVKPKEPEKDNEEEEEETSAAPVFKRPLKKEILTNDEDNQFIPVRAPLPSHTTSNNNDDDDETNEYKLKSIRKKPRGVLSTTGKKPIKPIIQSSKDDDEEEEDVNDELFEP